MKGLYPDETVPFHLPVHAGRPADSRPTFFTRFPTSRDEIKTSRLRQSAIDAGRDRLAADPDDLEGCEAATLDGLADLLHHRLTGWRHVLDDQGNPLDYSRDHLRTLLDHLSIEDGWGLLEAADAAVAVKREELGKSASPPPSPTAASAPPASPTPPAAGSAPATATPT